MSSLTVLNENELGSVHAGELSLKSAIILSASPLFGLLGLGILVGYTVNS